jgi:hypothetical protein
METFHVQKCLNTKSAYSLYGMFLQQYISNTQVTSCQKLEFTAIDKLEFMLKERFVGKFKVQ